MLRFTIDEDMYRLESQCKSYDDEAAYYCRKPMKGYRRESLHKGCDDEEAYYSTTDVKIVMMMQPITVSVNDRHRNLNHSRTKCVMTR